MAVMTNSRQQHGPQLAQPCAAVGAGPLPWSCQDSVCSFTPLPFDTVDLSVFNRLRGEYMDFFPGATFELNCWARPVQGRTLELFWVCT